MQGLINTLRSLGPGRIIALGVVTAGLIALFAFIISRFSATDMAPLFSGLEPTDSTAIVAELDSIGVEYELANGGATVMVPSTEVARLRMEMASNGLPGYGVIGYEIFDNLDALGTTSDIIDINRQRAIEGELARTIRWLDAVGNARVHLVLPQRQTFSRETQPPRASIILDIRGGRTITPDQVVAIQNLVASAINGMATDNVSVIDQSGKLLSQSTENNRGEQLQTAYEADLEHRIVELLSAYVGAGHVQAKVTAAMNFDLVTQSSTQYDPEGVVVGESTTIERERQSTEQDSAEGVTVLTELPTPQGNTPEGATSFSTDNSTEERVSNQLSVVNTETTFAPGAIERLSIAVMIDGSYDQTVTTDADGNEVSETTYRPRTEEELAALRSLVESAVGFDAARGDTLQVQNLQFADGMALAEMASGAGGDEPGLLDSMGIDLMRLIEIGMLAVLGVVAILFVVRPMLRGAVGSREPAAALAGPAGAPALTSAVGPDGQALLTGPEGEPADPNRPRMPTRTEMDEFIDLAKVEGQIRRSSINKVSEIIDNHPQEAVALIRNWLYAEDGQS